MIHLFRWPNYLDCCCAFPTFVVILIDSLLYLHVSTIMFSSPLYPSIVAHTRYKRDVSVLQRICLTLHIPPADCGKWISGPRTHHLLYSACFFQYYTCSCCFLKPFDWIELSLLNYYIWPLNTGPCGSYKNHQINSVLWPYNLHATAVRSNKSDVGYLKKEQYSLISIFYVHISMLCQIWKLLYTLVFSICFVAHNSGFQNLHCSAVVHDSHCVANTDV